MCVGVVTQLVWIWLNNCSFTFIHLDLRRVTFGVIIFADSKYENFPNFFLKPPFFPNIFFHSSFCCFYTLLWNTLPKVDVCAIYKKEKSRNDKSYNTRILDTIYLSRNLHLSRSLVALRSRVAYCASETAVDDLASERDGTIIRKPAGYFFSFRPWRAFREDMFLLITTSESKYFRNVFYK